MAKMLMAYEVADFGKWKSLFVRNAPFRKANGSMGVRVFRNKENPNGVTVLFDWDSYENAVKFSKLDKLRELMAEAGIMGKPDIYFLDEIAEINE